MSRSPITMPDLKNKLVEAKSPLISPELSASPKNEAADLEIPEHVKPEIATATPSLVSNVKVKAESASEGIEVVALRKGFYNQHRIVENEKFIVAKFDDLGEWMKCTDAEIQKKHLESIKLKKAKK